MTNVVPKSAALKVPPFYDPDQFRVKPQDCALFTAQLAGFVPPAIFDAHAHWYDMRIFSADVPKQSTDRSTWVGQRRYAQDISSWMGERCPQNGLFFPMPTRSLDLSAANTAVLEECSQFPGSRCLLIIGPSSDPVEVESQLRNRSVVGLKVYHLFASRTDTKNATPEEYIPQWAWELADQHGLCIMLHLVMRRSLAEERNQQYLIEHCRRYPNARVILAHAARGFCGRHTVEGIAALRGLGNLFFDTSVACEPEAMQAILATFGPTRLMFGSDYPLSEARGRAFNLGDGFHWIYEKDLPDDVANQVTLVGIESLMALKQACRTLRLRDSDIERIFNTNAQELLGISQPPAPTHGSGQALYLEAKQLIPGGTQLVSKRPEQYLPDKWPAYYSEARGCEVFDMDGRRYLDFATSGIGSCLLGYNHPAVTDAVVRRVQLGSMSTLNSPEEVQMSRLLLEMHPWAKKVRIARSGGEALAIAVRIARAGTRKDIVAFCGYHGWSDWYLAANLGTSDALAGHLLSGLNPAGVPGVLRGTALPFRYNQIDELRAIVRDHGARLAAVMMEPTRSTPPEGNFLHDVRQLCDDSGARLIFDEVTTGFRLHRGGVHLHFGVNPDMAVFAKALGNGHPIAAIIGKGEPMEAAQESFISSTYWTEGVGPTAAVATLTQMMQIDVPAHVRRIGAAVREGLSALARQYHVPLQITGYPALTYLAFDHAQANELMTLFTLRMLERGFLVGAFYPTLAHDDDAVNAYLSAAEPAMKELAEALHDGDVLKRIDGKVKHSGFKRLN